MSRYVALALLAALSTLALVASDGAPRAHAAPLTVTRTDDPPPDGCAPDDCSLREAVIAANANPGPDTIDLPAGTYVLSIVGSWEDASATGDLDIKDELTLTGEDAGTTIIDANDVDHVLDVHTATKAHLAKVTISNGNSEVVGGIYNKGDLTIEDSIVRDNTQFDVGAAAGLYNEFGRLTIRRTVIAGNTAQQSGGGITNSRDANLLIFDSSIDGNIAGTWGGGIANFGYAIIESSSVSGNSAHTGGGFSKVARRLSRYTRPRSWRMQPFST